MSNNKQSSLEQLVIALYENGYLQGNGDEIDDLLMYFKAMHKDEIFKSYEEGYRAAKKNIDPSCKCGLPKYGGYTCSRTDCDQNV